MDIAICWARGRRGLDGVILEQALQQITLPTAPLPARLGRPNKRNHAPKKEGGVQAGSALAATMLWETREIIDKVNVLTFNLGFGDGVRLTTALVV